MTMNRIMIVLLAASAGYLHQQAALRSTPPEPRNNEQIIRISASKFEFMPSEITVKKGVPVVLQLVSRDRHHGFKLSAFQVRSDITPGAVETVRFVPDKTGKFTFICDVFCGEGHEDMSGTLTVTEQ
jgi:cytochrome c oxidase subunit 2